MTSDTFTQRIRVPSSVIENAVRDYLDHEVGYAEGFKPKIISIEHSFTKNPYVTFKVTYENEEVQVVLTEEEVPVEREGLYRFLQVIK